MSHDDVAGEAAEDIDEDTLTAVVVASFAGAKDERLAQCLGVLVGHLHAAVRELEPSTAEWQAVVDFLTATGHTSDATRQEFVLLSDVLGISALIENINHRKAGGATEATVLGPFHMTESPPRRLGESIDDVGHNEICLITGRVLSVDGPPISGARVDVWQANDVGFYDVQQADVQPAGNGRGLFTTGRDGRFHFRTVVPAHYPIPTDGPVGTLLQATGRHPFRPAHIHFIAEADGYLPVTTHIFVAGSPYLGSDAVFSVKRSLVRDFRLVDDPDTAADHGLSPPYRQANIELILEPDPGGAQ